MKRSSLSTESPLDQFVKGANVPKPPIGPAHQSGKTHGTSSSMNKASDNVVKEGAVDIPMKRLVVYLPESLHMKLNHLCIDKKTSMTEFVLNMLMEYPELKDSK